MSTPETGPDWKAKESQVALDWMAAHPAVQYPLTKAEQLREDYADEIREAKAKRRHREEEP
jgi:hypothetical protein